jgi:hypothetical protein
LSTILSSGETGLAGAMHQVMVNVALPVISAWARELGDIGLESRCLRTYTQAPALPENDLTRESRRLIGMGSPAPGACAQQGLLHLYKRTIHPPA